MVNRGNTSENISQWLTPAQALEQLEAGFGDKHTALDELKERLRGGMVVAACHSTTIDGAMIKPSILNQIGSGDWDEVFSDNAVWTTGTLTIPGGYRTNTYETAKTIRFFDVRFYPGAIDHILEPHQRKPLTPTTSQEQESKGAPVSPAHLQAWFEFYKTVTKASDETEDYAWAHAKRCLPNNMVSRDSIRALRGNQKRGPKKKADPAE